MLQNTNQILKEHAGINNNIANNQIKSSLYHFFKSSSLLVITLVGLDQTWHKWGCMRLIRTTTEIYSSKFSLHRNQSEIIMFFCAPPNHNRYLNWVLSLNQNPNCVLGHYQNLQLWCIPPKSWRCASKRISFRRKLMSIAFKTRTGRK